MQNSVAGITIRDIDYPIFFWVADGEESPDDLFLLQAPRIPSGGRLGRVVSSKEGGKPTIVEVLGDSADIEGYVVDSSVPIGAVMFNLDTFYAAEVDKRYQKNYAMAYPVLEIN